MARRRSGQRDWRMTVFLVVSLIIVISMILAMFLPGIVTPS